MSNCRWSTDSFRCDVYCYESEEGFVIHVAGRRHGLPADDEGPPFSLIREGKGEEYMRLQKEFSDRMSASEWTTINHPDAGRTFRLDTESEMYDKLVELSDAGFNVPQHVLDSLAEAWLPNPDPAPQPSTSTEKRET